MPVKLLRCHVQPVARPSGLAPAQAVVRRTACKSVAVATQASESNTAAAAAQVCLLNTPWSFDQAGNKFSRMSVCAGAGAGSSSASPAADTRGQECCPRSPRGRQGRSDLQLQCPAPGRSCLQAVPRPLPQHHQRAQRLPQGPLPPELKPNPVTQVRCLHMFAVDLDAHARLRSGMQGCSSAEACACPTWRCARAAGAVRLTSGAGARTEPALSATPSWAPGATRCGCAHLQQFASWYAHGQVCCRSCLKTTICAAW